MAKTPIYLKLMIAIGMIIILSSLYFLKTILIIYGLGGQVIFC